MVAQACNLNSQEFETGKLVTQSEFQTNLA